MKKTKKSTAVKTPSNSVSNTQVSKLGYIKPAPAGKGQVHGVKSPKSC